MKQVFITKNNTPDLLLIFSGWGTHPQIFGTLRNARDICICYDYRDDTFNPHLIADYKDITVIGWSFGVYMAAYTFSKYLLKANKTVAVNGTMQPIDDTYGIPQTLFDMTLDSLTDCSFQKFQKRICGNIKQYSIHKEALSVRAIPEVKEELSVLQNRVANTRNINFHWDIAYISDNDLIFTPERQEAFWSNYHISSIRRINDAHFPDFKQITDGIFD